MYLIPSTIAFLLTSILFFFLLGIELSSALNAEVSFSNFVFAIIAPSNTMLADFVLPILLDISVAGIPAISISARNTGSLIRDESNMSSPFCLSLGWNLLSDASLIKIG